MLKELARIVEEERQKESMPLYIHNALKEYLQIYVLFFISTSPEYRKNLIFTGGTCLRHFYGLERLSVDIDFDFEEEINAKEFLSAIISFFSRKYKYSDVSGSIKQQGRQLLLKFPVLHELGLARGGESDQLYVKVDLSPLPSKQYTAVVTSKSRFGFNFVARHYDLPNLMAGKLHAILTRRYLRGNTNREGIKGRDYFDLLWFVKEGVKPNIERLSDMLGERMALEVVDQRVTKKVEEFSASHRSDFEDDMLPLIREHEIVKVYVENYRDEFLRYKSKSFASR